MLFVTLTTIIFMATNKQITGQTGEIFVTKNCICLKCKKSNSLKRLPTNFKCADLICDFCGYLAQVKTMNVRNENIIPDSILGAAWKPQKERMDSGIYFPLFIVLINNKNKAVYYLPAELQSEIMFQPRKKLSLTAKRAGWQGFLYIIKEHKNRIIRLI